jgi:transaldolase
MDKNLFTIDVYTDAIGIEQINEFAAKPWVKGFTTNPTLVRKSGASSYLDFAKSAVIATNGKPISLEVISDDLEEMYRQAHVLNEIGENIDVKIPITNTKKESTLLLVERLLKEGLSVNVTAIMTIKQVRELKTILQKDSRIIISIFAGRIADTGVNPELVMLDSINLVRDFPYAKVLWASPREVFNIIQAQKIGCHIITATTDLLKKVELFGKDLELYSLETVKMFYDDAKSAGYTL